MINYQLQRVDTRIMMVQDGSALYSAEPIISAERATTVMAAALSVLDREHLIVINLDAKGRPINYYVVSIGGLTKSLVPMSGIFKTAILSNAANILVMHQHPSGDPAPSDCDIAVTDQICRASALIGIPLLDHVVVGGGTGDIHSIRGSHPELFLAAD